MNTVYPRACGGTWILAHFALVNQGLSPRPGPPSWKSQARSDAAPAPIDGGRMD